MTDPHETTRVRTGDHETAFEGAADVTARAPTQRKQLLGAFFVANAYGLTDEQAANWASLRNSCFWKRCGELRRDGLIEFNGEARPGGAGTNRKVSVITDKGRKAFTNDD